MLTNEMIQAANIIPSMGGREIGPRISAYVSAMKNGLNIIEIGSWLGAGTAQIMTAMIEHDKLLSVLHVYDRFRATGSEIKKAKKCGVKLKPAMDTLPMVKRNLAPFLKSVNAEFYKGNAAEIKYNGVDIGIFVIDAAKRKGSFIPVIKEFEKHFIPGETICFFMDYYYYIHRPDEGFDFQDRYIRKSGKYTELEKHENLSCSIQRYDG